MQMDGGPWGAGGNKWGRAHVPAEAGAEGSCGSRHGRPRVPAPRSAAGVSESARSNSPGCRLVSARHHVCISSACSLTLSCL